MITKLLVANRGEIAERIMRSAHALGMATVAVFSDADTDAAFVRLAGESVHLPGRAPSDTYLRIGAVLAAAMRTGADAVHPGYGFLSERADFARACADAGLVFVGPSPESIEVMGSKLASKALVEAAGVPVLPGIEVREDGDVATAATTVGYPLLVKASAGGGGRGMRIVRDEAELADAVSSAAREATAAFGDGTVFLERLVERARHVEVQVFGDTHGNVTHLFERECSVQRRHQKIVEESPSPAVDAALRDRITDAAVAAARSVAYVNAGTVEFLLAPDGEFFFLEMNTRLQVEHPVTEMVTGLDLVALQLAVAQGAPLPREALEARLQGHAVEARLYAEDVPAGFLPASGRLDRFHVPERAGVRVDRGYCDGSVVSTYYDAMLAKVIAWGTTRDEAVHRLTDALAAAELHGPPTNRDLLLGVLRHPEFLAGDADTDFLVRHDPTPLATPRRSPAERPLHAVAAVLAARAARRGASRVLPGIPAGWRNVGPSWQLHELVDAGGDHVVVELADGRDGLVATVDGTPAAVVVHDDRADLVDLELDGHRVECRVQQVAERVYVDSALGATAFDVVPRFPLPRREEAAGSLRSPMPGTVIGVDTTVGAEVAAGAVLVTLEAMKMEHVVRAPRDGIVADVRVEAGDQVDAGDVLVLLADEPTG